MTKVVDQSLKATGLPRKIVIHLVSWLLLTVTTAAITSMNTWMTYRPFLARGVETQGRVIAKEPDNHEFIRFSYKVGLQAYTGLWGAGCGNPDFDSLKTNDSVLVTYDGTAPQSALLGNPRCWVRQDLPFILGVSIVVPLLIIVALTAKGVLPRL